MKMWKKLGAVALAACCITGVLSGCGEKEEKSPITAVSPKEGKIAVLANDEVADFADGYFLGLSEDYYGQGDHFAMVDLTLEWKADNPAETYEVSLSRKKDMSNATVYVADEESLTVSDLFVNTTYYWQVKGGEDVSEIFSFKTANTPRTITLEGVSNTRDIGGRETEDGKQIRQGMAYRGANLDNITENGRTAFTEKYGIKTDLDLRKAGEGYQQGSPVGESIKYYQYSCPYYTGGTTGIDYEGNYENLCNAMRVFADEDNYPIYFHCQIGRDRTSMVALLLLGVCGVSADDIMMDYEMSFFSESGCADGATVSNMISQVERVIGWLYRTYNQESFQDNCEAYLLEIGLTQAEIDSIRGILTE